jgi:hypothetical protein
MRYSAHTFDHKFQTRWRKRGLRKRVKPHMRAPPTPCGRQPQVGTYAAFSLVRPVAHEKRAPVKDPTVLPTAAPRNGTGMRI